MIKNDKIWIFILAIILSFSLYGNTIGGNFVYDDQLYNDRQELRNLEHIDDVFTEPYVAHSPEAGVYRPIVTASFILNYSIFGDSPVSFRIVNIFLNGIVSFLVFLIIFKLTENKKLSYLTFLIFSFLPIHTEAVSFIKSRDEILSLLFVLLSLLFFLNKKMVWSSVLLFFAILSKEITIIAPAIFIYIFISQDGFKLKEVIKKSLYYIPPFAGFVLLRFLALGQYAFGNNETQFIYNPLKFAEFNERISTALKVTYLFVQKLALPINLSANYFYNTIKVITNPFQSYQSILGILILITLIYFILSKKFRRNIIGIAAIIYLLPYLVFSNLIFTSGDIMGERWAYFPSIGFALIMAYPIYKAFNSSKYKTIGYITIISLLAFYGVTTINRNKVWASNISLYQNMLETAPNSVLTRNNLAKLYLANGYIDEAKNEAQKAIAIHPFPPTLDFMGEIYIREERYNEAESLFKQSIELNPKPVRSYVNLGQMYYEIGKYKESVEILEYPLSFLPTKRTVLLYSLSLIKLGQYQKAIDTIQEHSNNPSELQLKFAIGLAYFKMGEIEKANLYLEGVKSPELSEREFIKSLRDF